MNFKAFAVALATTLLVGSAQAQDQNIVLTPTALYDLIEKERDARVKVTHVLLRVNARLTEQEREIQRLKTASILTHQALNELRKRVVPGIQHQVTVLHAKKADKK